MCAQTGQNKQFLLGSIPIWGSAPLVRKNSLPSTDPRSKALRRSCDTSNLTVTLRAVRGELTSANMSGASIVRFQDADAHTHTHTQ